MSPAKSAPNTVTLAIRAITIDDMAQQQQVLTQRIFLASPQHWDARLTAIKTQALAEEIWQFANLYGNGSSEPTTPLETALESFMSKHEIPLPSTNASNDDYPFKVLNEQHPREIIRILRTRVAPIEVLNTWKWLRKTPQDTYLSTQLRKWEETHEKAQGLGLPEISGVRPVLDFIDAIEPISDI
jgi:hypothetical protein